MDFKGKICPYCKTEFKEDDEVVICSLCNMPHHKECWVENQGCTTFGCTGTIKGINQNQGGTISYEVANNVTNMVQPAINGTTNTIQPNINDVVNQKQRKILEGDDMYCPQCGIQTSRKNRFCPNCGVKIHDMINAPMINQYTYIHQVQYNQDVTVKKIDYTQPLSNQYRKDAFSERERLMCEYIGDNSMYYMNKYFKMKEKNSIVSWNWPAFFFSNFWLIYRKMYLYAVIVWLISFFNIIISINSSNVLGWIIWIVMGIFGNNLYIKHVEKFVDNMSFLDFEQSCAYARKKGGTNIVGVIVAVVVVCIVTAVSVASYI